MARRGYSSGQVASGVMHDAQLRPMTNVRLQEIRNEKDLNHISKKVRGQVEDNRRRLIQAKMKEAQANIRKQAENKGPDVWHVLVESRTGKKIKAAAMSRAEGFRRNKTIHELGMEWTLGEM